MLKYREEKKFNYDQMQFMRAYKSVMRELQEGDRHGRIHPNILASQNDLMIKYGTRGYERDAETSWAKGCVAAAGVYKLREALKTLKALKSTDQEEKTWHLRSCNSHLNTAGTLLRQYIKEGFASIEKADKKDQQLYEQSHNGWMRPYNLPPRFFTTSNVLLGLTEELKETLEKKGYYSDPEFRNDIKEIESLWPGILKV